LPISSRAKEGEVQRLSRKLRKQHYYMIPNAGAQVGWSRSEAYRAARRGDIPTESFGRLKLVPRAAWDVAVRLIKRGQHILPRSLHRDRPRKGTAGSAEA
jgi:hypothetical protein